MKEAITIREDQIAKRDNAPSSMPAMTYQLTKRELRKVVSFRATLKEDKQ